MHWEVKRECLNGGKVRRAHVAKLRRALVAKVVASCHDSCEGVRGGVSPPASLHKVGLRWGFLCAMLQADVCRLVSSLVAFAAWVVQWLQRGALDVPIACHPSVSLGWTHVGEIRAE